MPLTRIFLKRGKDAAYHKALLDNVYLALRETFDVPDDDRFMVLSEHDGNDFIFGENYLGIHRTNDLVLIQLTVSNTRSLDKKRALYRRIVERLSENPGVRPEDVFINLVEVLPENWSLGLGEAQYAK